MLIITNHFTNSMKNVVKMANGARRGSCLWQIFATDIYDTDTRLHFYFFSNLKKVHFSLLFRAISTLVVLPYHQSCCIKHSIYSVLIRVLCSRSVKNAEFSEFFSWVVHETISISAGRVPIVTHIMRNRLMTVVLFLNPLWDSLVDI